MRTTGTTLTVLSAPRHDRDAFDHVDVALRMATANGKAWTARWSAPTG